MRTQDTTRPVTLAAAFPELSSHIGFFDALDVVGYNYKEHLYEESHKRFPDKPFLGSENGGGYEQWCAVRDNAYISGQFLWTGIDYLGEAHGWPIHGSSAGLMDLAGFEKPGFYRRKAFWSTEPFACILTRQMMVMSMSGDRGMHIGIIQMEKMSLYEYSQICKKKLFLLV